MYSPTVIFWHFKPLESGYESDDASDKIAVKSLTSAVKRAERFSSVSLNILISHTHQLVQNSNLHAERKTGKILKAFVVYS